MANSNIIFEEDRDLTINEERMLQEHSTHHTSEHLREMRYLMQSKHMSFDEAHIEVVEQLGGILDDADISDVI